MKEQDSTANHSVKSDRKFSTSVSLPLENGKVAQSAPDDKSKQHVRKAKPSLPGIEAVLGPITRPDQPDSVSGVKLTSRLTMQDLKAVQDAFSVRENAKERELSLTKDQFCELLSIVLTKGTEEEYIELFDKVDVTKEGFIDWDKLCSYLLLEYYEKDDRMKTTQVPQWRELKQILCPHKDVIYKVSFMNNPPRYCTVSREGTVCFWNQDLKITRSVQIQTNPEEVKPRDLWVTSFSPLANIHKLAIAMTSKEIVIYDLSSKTEFNCYYRIQGLLHTPLCISYWSNPNNSSHGILSFGDTAGQVHALVFTNAAIALFERQSQPPGSAQDSCLTVSIHDVMKNAYKHVKYYKHIGHSNWVRQVSYIPNLDCFISCATTNNSSMVLGWIEKAKIGMRMTTFRIPQGINAFDYSEKANIIATAGINNHVCLWNPYVISKPVGVLQGHIQSVVAVTFIQKRDKLISLSKDKVLRIWDTHLQVVLQRLSGLFPKGSDMAISMYFDEERARLFTSFNQKLTLLVMKAEIKDKIISHENAITAVAYNSNFNQVVSVCAGSVITMWMIDTGQKVKQFSNSHGNSEITCLAQDPTEMRLLTGSTDGTIKIWDFNGHCHHILMAGHGNPCEISQILYLKRSILAVGWDRTVISFPTAQLKSFYVSPSDWKGRLEHQDDIVRASFSLPHTLATASYDGEIILWNVITENAFRHMSSQMRPIGYGENSRQVSPVARGGSRSSAHLKVQDISARKTPTGGRHSPCAVSPGIDDDPSTLAWSFAISKLIFLTTRPVPVSRNSPANLVSCTGGGVVRFWNTFTSEVVGEFDAHEQASFLTMETDSYNKYLVTGDGDGVCKVWGIDNYCQTSMEIPVKETPQLLKIFIPHTDVINSICLIPKHDDVLIISGSSDCSVALHTIKGTQVGIFGQEVHWDLDRLLQEEKMQLEKEEIRQEQIVELQTGEDLDTEDKITVKVKQRSWEQIKIPSRGTNATGDLNEGVDTWHNTILGKAYQEGRSEKRERKQPYVLPFINFEKTGQHLVGAYKALMCKDLDEVSTLQKPDFVSNPDKYFAERPDVGITEQVPSLPPIVDSLQQRHDEKSLFPKYILDMDIKRRMAHNMTSQYKMQGQRNHRLSVTRTNSNSQLSSISALRTNLMNMNTGWERKSAVWNKKLLKKITSAAGIAEELSSQGGSSK